MKQAIIKTLIYADLFDYPLREGEIWQRLIWQKKEKPKQNEFKTALEQLKKEKEVNKFVSSEIKEKQSFYFLPGRERIISRRREREKESENKLTKTKRVACFLKVIPTVKFIGVSGSVAAANASSDDDIDIFIITASNWLWTTRFLVTLMLSLLGVRRKPGDEHFKDKICPNLYLDEGHLNIFAKDKNLFIAYEIINLKLLWQRDNAFNKFIKANYWVKEFLPNAKFS